MRAQRAWQIVYWVLWAAFVVTAALNMLHVRAGFLTSHAADVVVPALLYVMFRGLAERDRPPTLVRRWFGGTPERAGATLFLASAATEWSQRYWPKGIFPGRYDPLDIVAFGVGVAVCYGFDKWGSTRQSKAAALMAVVTLLSASASDGLRPPGMPPGAATAGAVQFDAPGRPQRTDLTYDGRFTFVRLRWQSDMGFSRRGGFSAAWNHDYPRAEQNLGRILQSLTVLDIRIDGSLILTLDDPELFKYPVAFMWEPGFWNLTDREAESFRSYLLKGGFAVFEDFDGAQQWNNFEGQMRRVLPDGRFVKLDDTHRIFDSFFHIKDIHAIVHPMTGIRPSYYGIFEDNDPGKRLMVVANYDNDVPEYWEWSAQGIYPFDASNEAYKLGVNYLIYGLTH